MILRNALIPDIIEKWGEKNVYMYGAGQKLKDLESKYTHDLKFAAVIDQDVDKQKKGHMDIWGRKIPVISLESFIEKNKNRNVCMILTMDYFHDLYTKLEDMPELAHVSCYINYLIKLAEEDERLYPKEYELPTDAFLKNTDNRIPRVIHYCWFGKKDIPKMYLQYMESWKKYCPDYEIIQWDETNYDVTKNAYMYAAYKDKKWAYVSDYARIDIVNQYGGIYLDTDVELIRTPDILLKENAFCGYESLNHVNLGLGFGAVKHNPVLESLLQYYEKLTWDGGKIACPVYQTEVLRQYGMTGNNRFQRLNYITLYPTMIFCGKSAYTRRIMKTEDTFSIHHYTGSWFKPEGEEKFFEQLRKRAVY